MTTNDLHREPTQLDGRLEAVISRTLQGYELVQHIASRRERGSWMISLGQEKTSITFRRRTRCLQLLKSDIYQWGQA